MPAYQLQLKEKDNSLRIISVVIESMKHWSQYTNKVPLLFEMMGKYNDLVDTVENIGTINPGKLIF